MNRRSKKKQRRELVKRSARAVPSIVPHPRYGDAVVPSGCNATAEQIRESFWGYWNETIFPESAIPADITRQSFSTFPRGFYVDVLKQCRACKRPFIFFAKEQQYWYETLGFYIDADCRDCPECRRSNRQLRDRFRRYSEAVGRADLNDRELITLAGDAVFLWQVGVLRDEQRLRRLRNLTRKRIPDSAVISKLDDLLAELKARAR